MNDDEFRKYVNSKKHGDLYRAYILGRKDMALEMTKALLIQKATK